MSRLRPLAVIVLCTVVIGALCWGTAAGVCAGEPAVELLWPEAAPGALGDEDKDKPKLIVYLPEKAKANKTAVVICPGGGYGFLAMGHEGHDIAKWLNSIGVAGFICDYRHRSKGYGHPAPLQDAQQAIRTVRANADRWNVDPKRIGIMGFSAGGHLASSAGTHFDDGDAAVRDPVERVSCRPDFLILCYPVIAFDEPYTHRGSQKNLLGAEPEPALVKHMSSEKQVTAETPPTFLFHTDADTAVPPENSVQFYLALRRHKVPAEMHIFQPGRHGVGLAPSQPALKIWPALCESWLRTRGLLETGPQK